MFQKVGLNPMIKAINEREKVMNYAWNLCKDDLHTSYPRLNSIEKVKEHIEKAIDFEYEKIIACYRRDALCGVCIYFWKPNEKYAQTTMFLIKDNYDEIADEFITYIGEQIPGYDLLIGVPFSNNNANNYFKKRNITCIESSIDTRLYDLRSHINLKHNLVERITKDNFKEYQVFHDKHAIPLEMYYNSKNLKKDIDKFRVFAIKKYEVFHASIFVKVFGDSAEIFGLFIDDEYKYKNIERILIDEVLMQLCSELGILKEIIYFIDEDNTKELDTALAAGFSVSDTYRCYKIILQSHIIDIYRNLKRGDNGMVEVKRATRDDIKD